MSFYSFSGVTWLQNPVTTLLFRYAYEEYLTSLVAQMVKHLSTMQETWVQSLGWEDSLEKETATHSSALA